MSAAPAAARRRTRAAWPAPPQPQLRLVAPRRRTARYVAVLLAAAAAGVFGVVSLGALAAESSFSARELDAEVKELSLRYDELTAEVAALEAPDRIRAVAVDELGMVAAERPGFLVADGGDPEHSAGPRAAGGLRDGPVADPVKPVLQLRH